MGNGHSGVNGYNLFIFCTNFFSKNLHFIHSKGRNAQVNGKKQL